MKTIIRPESLVTGKCNLEPLISLKNFPAFIGCTTQSIEKDIRADMNWSICPESGCIQLVDLLPQEVVYAEYHSEAVGDVWSAHHDEFVDFCAEFKLSNVLEIGGSNGAIAEKYIDRAGPVGWTIIEPNPGFSGNKNIKVINRFFDSSLLNDSYQHIVHSHVLEHTIYPLKFLADIHQFMQADSLQIFSVPNLYDYLKSKFSNTINFEHTFLLTEYLIDFMLEKQGFKIIEKRYFQQHSIFYATSKSQPNPEVESLNYRSHYQQLFLALLDEYRLEVIRLNKLIASVDIPVYLFGAHIFSQFLIYFGLNQERVVGILDNSKQKNSKRLYGTASFVNLPDVICSLSSVVVIVKAGQYQKEVIQQLRNLNKHILIWE